LLAGGVGRGRTGFGGIDSSAGAGDVVTYIGAGLVTILVGWVIDTLLQPYLGTGATLILSFVISTVAFFMARRWLNELRHG
jgi:fucose permease